MGFLFGFLGALTGMGLLAGGGVIGWHVCKAVLKHATPELEKPGEAELKREAERQQAFHLLQGYSAERAYGMVEDLAVSPKTTGGDFR